MNEEAMRKSANRTTEASHVDHRVQEPKNGMNVRTSRRPEFKSETVWKSSNPLIYLTYSYGYLWFMWD